MCSLKKLKQRNSANKLSTAAADSSQLKLDTALTNIKKSVNSHRGETPTKEVPPMRAQRVAQSTATPNKFSSNRKEDVSSMKKKPPITPKHGSVNDPIAKSLEIRMKKGNI